MKKISVTIAVIAALAASYSAASWITGKHLETKLAQTPNQDLFFPAFKVVKQTYRRGLFSSTQESTIELNIAGLPHKDATPPPPAPDGNAVAANPNEVEKLENKLHQAPQFHIINHIQHGPIPGIVGIAASKVDTELVLDAASMAEIKKVFGEKKFLEIRTVLNYNGGGTVKISSPAINANVGTGQDKLNWKGIGFEIGFDAAYKKLKFDLASPGLEMNAADGSSALKIGEIKMNGNAERAYPEGFIYLGTSKASVHHVAFSNTKTPNVNFAFNDLSLENATTSKNDLIDTAVKFSIAKIELNKTDFGNFHYDYSLTHLHGPTISKLLKDLHSFNQTGNPTGTDSEKTSDLHYTWKQLSTELLKHNPVFSLDRLSLTSKGGEFRASATVKLTGADTIDMENPTQLLSTLDSVIDISLAEPLVQELVENTQTDPNARTMMLNTFHSQVAALEAQGYIQRNDTTIHSQIVWKEGKLLINGKAYPPAPVFPAPDSPPLPEQQAQ